MVTPNKAMYCEVCNTSMYNWYIASLLIRKRNSDVCGWVGVITVHYGTHLILLLLNVNGVLVDDDGDIADNDKLLLGVDEGVDCLLGTVRDIVLLFVVAVVSVTDVVTGNDSDAVVAVVTAIDMVLFELMLCDLTVSLRGDGGTCTKNS